MWYSPKILLFDIETAGVQGLRADRGFCVCFGYKWLGKKDVHCITLNEYPGKHAHDDGELLKVVNEIMAEADGYIAHYGENFDRKFLESRFLRAGLPPIPNNKLCDTCLIARGKLALSSNRLANLAKFLGVENEKMEKGNGWPDWWLGALRGDKKSIVKMAVYCKQDVRCLEDCYLKMRHMIPTKFLPVNAAIGSVLPACPACGSREFQSRGVYYSEQKLWPRRQCKNCYKWFRGPKPTAGVSKL